MFISKNLKFKATLSLCWWLFLVVSIAFASADENVEFAEDILNSFDKTIGSRAVRDKIAELTKSSGNERQQIIVVKKSDIAGDILESELHNTTSIVKNIGDITVVVNTTFDSTKDGDGIVIVFETEVRPLKNTHACKKDSNCSDHQFCRRETLLGFDLSYCVSCSQNGGGCRADNHCCQNSICRWGRCREDADRGQVGTICSQDGECGGNLCCALIEGFTDPLCLPLANEGQPCRVKEAPKSTANDSSESPSLLDKLLGRRDHDSQHAFTTECPCMNELKCINYGQTLVNIFDFVDPSSSGGICVPNWAKGDPPMAETLDEIKLLQSKQISDVIGPISKN